MAIAYARRLVLGLAGAVVVSACGGDDDDGPTAGPVAGTASLRVANVTSRPIFFVFFSACSDSLWGPDRLGADRVIPVGQSVQWDSIPPGCTDLRAELDDGRAAERFAATLTRGGTFVWSPDESRFRNLAATIGAAAPALAPRTKSEGSTAAARRK
jgi:hypothetical protein